MDKIQRIKLVDSSFPTQNALGLAGERIDDKPLFMEWDRTDGRSDVKVWTDWRIKDVVDDTSTIKVALLIESPMFNTAAYEHLENLHGWFNAILTYDWELGQRFPNTHPYYFGGSWIKEWGTFDKSKNVSILVGKKTEAEGQQLRHAIAEQYGDEIDLWGEPYTAYIPSKTPALRPYRYSVVIENCKKDMFFTEKLIDCFSQGTIPIFWGCPSIATIFDPRGMILFDDISELPDILMGISEDDYRARFQYVLHNLALAEQYSIAEDSITLFYDWFRGH